MTQQEIEILLKKEVGIAKEIIALKPLKKLPENIPCYEGVAVPGLCTMIGEVLTNPVVTYSVRENHQCYEGLIATGVCAVSREEFREAVETWNDMCPYHKDMDTAMAFYEKCLETIPAPPVQYSGLVCGPLSKVADPDLVVIFCTPHQAEIFNRAQSYLGNIVQSYGGNGGCIFNLRGPFVTRQPTYSTSDFPWRTFVGLADHEMTVIYPYERLVEIAPYIKSITDYVGTLKSMFSGQ
jgi:uncharacterized protein (DUF169 family)